jgi:hypothetical protein
MFDRTAAPTRDEKALEMRLPQKRMALRRVSSRRVYHFDRMRSAPGRMLEVLHNHISKHSLTWQESGLHESNEESNGNHAGEVGHVSGESRDHAPKEHYTANVDRWSRDTVDDHVLES